MVNDLGFELGKNAETVGNKYTSEQAKEHKKTKGQFFTPLSVAKYMASLVTVEGKRIKILDPGCGLLILSSALIDILSTQKIEAIELVAYETDASLRPFIMEQKDAIKSALEKKGIEFLFTLVEEDFILSNKGYYSSASNLFLTPSFEQFDIAVLNPPYFKINNQSEYVKLANEISSGHPNIYSLFLSLVNLMVREGGEIISITPRSFTSGQYFKSFRKTFFKQVKIEHLHLFESRNEVFKLDSVLLETIIMKGIKKAVSTNDFITITTSTNSCDLNELKTFKYKYDEVVSGKDYIIHTPTSIEAKGVMDIFRSWTGSFLKYNLRVSTGPVVAYRTVEFTHLNPTDTSEDTVPLFWLTNVIQMKVEYPIDDIKKPQYVAVNPKTQPFLIPNKNYILMRRFSSKDDKSRLIASPYFANYEFGEFIGVENKLNYIHRPKGFMDRFEVIGVSALLNSELFDCYFRSFNGNINVSSTELHMMPLPPLADILDLGKKLMLLNDFSKNTIDGIINAQYQWVK